MLPSPRPLPYLLRFQYSVAPQEITGEDAPCTSPVYFPEDADEPLPVVFSCSLNEYTQMLSALIIGAQVIYPNSFVDVMNMFMRNWECDMDLCERVALCFTEENSALMDAVAAAIRNNPTLRLAISDAISQEGGAIPGLPLSETEAASNSLPENVYDEEGDCIYDNLWGGCLYLVQTANRAINDFFEILESAGNTLETATIVAETIPAAGDYVAAAGAFADQLQENISEGYAAAYTEEYEEQLACSIFCVAKENCDLSIDQLVDILNQRLPDPGDFSDFGLVMARIGSGTYSGPEIADVAFYLYFTALRFGQQFGDTLGIRPLTDMMSLGADFLSSDNWEILCDCPTVCTAPSFVPVPIGGFSGGTVDTVDNMDGTWEVTGTAAVEGGDGRLLFADENQCCWKVISITYDAVTYALDAHYECGASPNEADPTNGLVTGALEVDGCYGGLAASRTGGGFTVVMTVELCP